MARDPLLQGSARVWTCQRQTAGVKCGCINPAIKRNCEDCKKPRPKRKQPAHRAALELSYEEYVEINGGEACGICGAEKKIDGNRLHRDHDHATGRPRGILCFRCNTALPNRVTLEWLRAAIAYLERAG